MAQMLHLQNRTKRSDDLITNSAPISKPAEANGQVSEQALATDKARTHGVATTAGEQSRSLAAKVQITRASLAEMPLAADILRSTAEWYRPIVAEQDMGEHAVDEHWATKTYLARECYLARVDGEPVGFVTLQHCGDFIYVGYAYVPAHLVGQGIGRRLLAHAGSVAKERGYRGVVHIGHPDASWAVRAYEKYGYQVVLRDRAAVLGWNFGFLKPYYEEGFVLFRRWV